MRKDRKFSTKMLLVLLFISVGVTGIFLVLREPAIQRHRLLCVVLKPGMSQDQVIEVLHQAGEFTMRKAEWSAGDIELGISFTNLKGRFLYGHFALRFFDYQYAQAYITRFDEYDFICDFTQANPSALP